jgi:hypothetical protein
VNLSGDHLRPDDVLTVSAVVMLTDRVGQHSVWWTEGERASELPQVAGFDLSAPGRFCLTADRPAGR